MVQGPFLETFGGVWNGEIVTQVIQAEGEDGGADGDGATVDGGVSGDGIDGGSGGSSDAIFELISTAGGEQGFIRASYLVPVRCGAAPTYTSNFRCYVLSLCYPRACA